MVSDSSGDTVIMVGKAVMSQFENTEVKEYIWPLIRTREQVDDLLFHVKKAPGIILYTIVNDELRYYLKKECENAGTLCISVISRVIQEVANYIGDQASRKIPGKQVKLDSAYFRKMEAINYTMHHDDGQLRHDYNKADILILGVSRTSKSPTSLYLAQRGYKVANLPIINKVPYDFSDITKPLIIGLEVSADYLVRVRENRLFPKGKPSVLDANNNNYTEMFSVKEEINYANKIFRGMDIPVIDVTSKAVEEVVAEIVNVFFVKKGGHLLKV